MSSARLNLPDNSTIPLMLGANDDTLGTLRKSLKVEVEHRGNVFMLRGEPQALINAKQVLTKLYDIAAQGKAISSNEVQYQLRRLREAGSDTTLKAETVTIGTQKIEPQGQRQFEYLQALKKHRLVFGCGPAGTGKTYLGVIYGLSMLKRGEVERIIITRPVIEAGEKLGFLPGDLKEKIDPYLRPIHDILISTLTKEGASKFLENGTIEIAPLAYMRGRTLKNAFVLLDEGQNATDMQMKMFLTRFGQGSRMVITGDPSQSDLPNGTTNGLDDATRRLKGMKDCGILFFENEDIVRHPLVASILERYNDS